jgi:hypothetical protein
MTNSEKLLLECCKAKLWKGQKCICNEISIIKKIIRQWYTKLKKLEQFVYGNDVITYKCIDLFRDKNRSKNDSNNKKRENIIECIIKYQ